MAKQEMGGSAMDAPGTAHLNRFSVTVLDSDNVVPVVLEFQQPPAAVYKRLNPQADLDKYQSELSKVHQEFLDKLSSLGMVVQVGTSSVVVARPQGSVMESIPHDFTYVFNGMGVLMPGRVVAQVAQMAGVRAVTHNNERVYLNLDKSVPFLGSPQIWERLDTAGRNIRGEGVMVAIIDTGIDWTHPSFGGFTTVPNDKVVYAASFTGEPPQDNFGHGTHVSAIIGADAEYKGTPRGDALLNGMAPKAKLMGYKVLTASGSGSATNIILAMEDAVRRGAQVINLSLGDVVGDPYSPESSAANNAMVAGVVVCVAAGNAGPEVSSIGAPGAAHSVITVGASTDSGVTALMAQLIQADLEPRNVEMRLMERSMALAQPAMELQYVECGPGLKPEDFPKQVKNRIALVQRGEITFLEKAQNAKKAGALACVIYNNREGNFFGTLGEEAAALAIPVVSISKADGEFMIELIKGKGEVSQAKLRLSPEEVPQPYRLAEFSSRGPNNDRWIKPELTAPGVNINSATILEAPTPGGGMPDPSGYTSASGTSMATPHVAGAAALIRQAHPDWTALQIKAALVNTAHWMPDQGGIMDQGNGCMDLPLAVDCQAILVTATDPINPTHSFGQVVHEGQEVRVTQALTIQELITGSEPSNYRLEAELVGQPTGLRVELSAGSVVCNGESCVASFELALIADGAVLPDGPYSGFVHAVAAWGTLRLPFYIECSKAAGKPTDPSNEQPNAQNGERRRVGCMPTR